MASEQEKNANARQGNAQPQTCCPNCGTVFEVSSEHLASSDTRVRCGECLSIFDALINLRSDESLGEYDHFHIDEEGNVLDADGTYANATVDASETSIGGAESQADPGAQEKPKEPAGKPADTAGLDVTYSDYDLFSGEAALPEVAYFDQTQDLDNLRFDEPDGDETFSDTLFVHDMTLAETTDVAELTDHEDRSPALQPAALDTKVDFVSDDVQPDPVVYVYRDTAAPQSENNFSPTANLKGSTASALGAKLESSKEQRSSSPWMTRALMAFFIVLLVTVLWVFKSRSALLENPDVRPWLAKTCTLIGCELDPVINLDALKVLKRSVFSHPTIDNALVIDLAFVNQAAIDQPYPVLEIRLTNSAGGLVVQNNIAPSDYLDEWQEKDLLAAGERLDLSLTVEDPGQTASSFELKFR